MIEDDIDAALDAALEHHPLDRERICALGASYGGYSSMISSIRRPSRYRCVVSMMGVSDATLTFTASDSTWTEHGRAFWQGLVGDPRTDLDELEKHSPLYRYDELRAPLLLIHGDEDRRVDFEHTRRLSRMLGLAGRPPQLVEVKGAGHGITTAEQRALVYPALVKFLQDHLGAP
jgi:dipeptidyl aminopeptidase/acylaminoacyl peptidase